MVLLISILAVLLISVLGIWQMWKIKEQVLSDSEQLADEAITSGTEVLVEQMEQNLISLAISKTDYAEAQLSNYWGYIDQFVSYIEGLYAHPENYRGIKVNPPDEQNAGTYSLQRTYAGADVDEEAVAEEMELLGNVEQLFHSVMAVDGDVIATIYLGTESGFMISYDTNSDVESEYYNYYEASWYTQAKERGDFIFTDTYEDSYGRGLTISCAAPFYDAEGNFAGVVSMDILIGAINQSIISMESSDETYAFLINKEGNIITVPDENVDMLDTMNIYENTDFIAREVADELTSGGTGITEVEGERYFIYAPIESAGWILVIHTPATTIKSQAGKISDAIMGQFTETTEMISKNIRNAIRIFTISLLVVVIVTIFVSNGFAKRIIEPINQLRLDVQKISKGDLDYRAKIMDNDEIGDLAEAFNNMTISLEEYIKNLTAVTAEKERIGAELNVATQIQADMLPSIFPAFPGRKEFDIYASMTPAKEVGGDFYDFFLTDENHLAMVIADVSGKGVPAALFMVIAKTLLKNRAQMGDSPKKILEVVNQQLCENNKAEMFVTVWLGIMEISTGHVVAANAGHEYPILRKADGQFEVFKDKHGFVLAGMEGIKYKEYEFEMDEGDCLFVYTDGVPEATNSQNELFGMDRLLDALNKNAETQLEALLNGVKQGIDTFVCDAAQFDDITMLAVTRTKA
jgi:sigma-B regulation protein RsbU (phosphoserine phosphatase)